jgi:predicted ferric reductase
MTEKYNQTLEIDEIAQSVNIYNFLLVVTAAMAGAIIAIILLPSWIPGLSSSIAGQEPKFYWYLARGSAFMAYGLLWLSVILGVGITNKLAAIWPGLPSAIDLHQYTSILGLAISLFHGLILLGDQYLNLTVTQFLLPFSTISFKPFHIGIGQLAFYLWIIVVVSFYVRKLIGAKTWRLIHYASFMMFALTLAHGVITGTDTKSLLVQYFYWLTGITVLALTVYRIIRSKLKARQRQLSRTQADPTQ